MRDIMLVVNLMHLLHSLIDVDGGWKYYFL